MLEDGPFGTSSARMDHAVFVCRSDSDYDNDLPYRYHLTWNDHFIAERCVGSWILYCEPRSLPGSRGYFAMAALQELRQDPQNLGMFYAILEAGSYLEFPDPIPHKVDGTFLERGLVDIRGTIRGKTQRAVRIIGEEDFGRITTTGFGKALEEDDQGRPAAIFDGIRDDGPSYDFGGRVRQQIYSSRAIRDRAFRALVLPKYDYACAFTGIRMQALPERFEAEAAHVHAAAAHGPDMASNGIAMSGTIHWSFDAGHISLTDDLRILVGPGLDEKVRKDLNPSGYLTPPLDPLHRPHPRFLAWHRDNPFRRQNNA